MTEATTESVQPEAVPETAPTPEPSDQPKEDQPKVLMPPPKAEEAKEEFPKEIELTELEAMSLTAMQATVGKVMAEMQLISMKAALLQKEISDRQSLLPSMAMREKEIKGAIAERYGLPDLSQYSLDLEACRGTFVPQRPMPAKR